ncbi:MAG: hypothetical protein V9G22_15770 [Ottowia sp.]
MRMIKPGALLALGLLTVAACSGSVETPSSSSGGGGGSTSSTLSTTLSWSGSSSTSNGGAASCEDPPPSTGNAPVAAAWAMALGDGMTPAGGDFIAADAQGNVLLSGGIGGLSISAVGSSSAATAATWPSSTPPATRSGPSCSPIPWCT